MRAYEYRHIVSFEETNMVGNVYFANHVRWQGNVREMFLREHAPEVLSELSRGLSLVTVRVSCEYYQELFAFDEVLIRMYAGALTQSRVTMLFDYVRITAGQKELVARGEQQIACMQRHGKNTIPMPLPQPLREALLLYAER